ncbi:MAG: hypothetical protein CME86_26515 [Herbaspirillum sp.]|nr:hypothetical protein [Herbaspirillum sp.]|tara:strand:+ start:377 stop:1597 length:1221 start_codon:yes stop_codon:yes gene_type:complete
MASRRPRPDHVLFETQLKGNVLRQFVIAVVGLGLAVLLAGHTASLALTKKAPETSAMLFPFNGLAHEYIASALLTASAADNGMDESGVKEAEDWARLAYREEPLTPKAHAVLLLGLKDKTEKSRALAIASGLNRREPRLQAVVLQDQVAEQDYPGAIATLDRILRVRPSRGEELFPALLPVFVQEGALEEFAKVLDGSSPWHDAFFRYAVKQPAALPNLLELRKQIVLSDLEMDRTLLLNLVSEGEIDLAYSFYEHLRPGVEPGSKSAALEWASTYSPFDWQFTNERGLRAQASWSFDKLEVGVRPGSGGVVARRILKAPDTSFVVRVEHDETSEDVLRDIDIGLRCHGSSGAPILDAKLADGTGGYEVSKLPASCAYIEITLAARAWSGRQALDAEIASIRLEPK